MLEKQGLGRWTWKNDRAKCGKEVENASLSKWFSSFHPWTFHIYSYGQGKDKEKFFSAWKTMWKMLQKHVFSRDTAFFDSFIVVQTGKHYIFQINI